MLTLENLFRKEVLRHQSERFLGEPRAAAFQIRSLLIVSSLLLFLAIAAITLLNVRYSRTVHLTCSLAVSGKSEVDAGAAASRRQMTCPVARDSAEAVLTAVLKARSSMGAHITEGHMRRSRGTSLDLTLQPESAELLLVTDRFKEPATAGQKTVIISVDMGRPKTFVILFGH